MARTVTPPRRNANGSTTYVTQRCCDGCGRELGDVYLAEIDQYMTTGRLPSVVDECGCQQTRDTVGTGAGEASTGQDAGSDGVTRSMDCPEAPAQAHRVSTHREHQGGA